MMKILLISLGFFYTFNTALAQNFMQFIREHALIIPDLTQLDIPIYRHFQSYEFFLVGEMHGTNEPARFVQSLAKLIADHEEKVCVGLEIPAHEMALFIQSPNDSTLRHCAFFQAENLYGRNGEACFELIQALYKHPRINLFFFDDLSHPNRDSMMAVHVLQQKKLHPHTKIITLSGNIHNWLKPFHGEKTMGTYLYESRASLSHASIISINHIYNRGTMLNNTGNGLGLKTIEGVNSIYSKALGATNYLCPIFLQDQNQYNWFLYTDQVSASMSLKY